MAVGPDNNLWYTEMFENRVGRMTTSGAFVEFNLPTGSQYPDAIAAGPDGAVWFIEDQFFTGGKVGRVSLSGEIKEFPMITRRLHGLTAGPDGNLWITAATMTDSGSQEGAILRMTPDGEVTEYLLGESNQPGAITVGPDGALWFGDSPMNAIGRMDVDGNLREFRIPTPYSAPLGIAVGADGHPIWFGEAAANKIGRLEISEFVAASRGVPGVSQTGAAILTAALALLGFLALYRYIPHASRTPPRHA